MRRLASLSIVLAMFVTACQLFASHPPVAIGAWNDTDLAVVIRANGTDAAMLPPGANLPADAALPLPPFEIEAASASG